MNDLILVTGAARSGISLVGSIIKLCGAWVGETGRSKKEGIRGSVENVRIRDYVIKPFLHGVKADPNGQNPLPDIGACKKGADKVAGTWRRLVIKILRAEGYHSGPAVIVSSLNCLIWPLWAQAFPDARWIIVRRADNEIIRACIRTGFMVGYSTKKGWQGWLDVHKERFGEMIGAGLNIWQIWPHRMVKGKLQELQQLVDTLGLSWDEQAIRDFITPVLWKSGVFETG